MESQNTSTQMMAVLNQSESAMYRFVDLTQRQPTIHRATRSIYALTRQEITKGLANRFVHSRTYIFLYLGMAALSITTIVLSLTDGCPGLPFYILEVIINVSMILEVAIRFVAFGRVSVIQPCT